MYLVRVLVDAWPCCSLGSNLLVNDGDQSGQEGDAWVLEDKRWVCGKWQARGHLDTPRGSRGLNYRAPEDTCGPRPPVSSVSPLLPRGLRVHTSGQLLSGSTPSATPLLAPRTTWGRQSPWRWGNGDRKLGCPLLRPLPRPHSEGTGPHRPSPRVVPERETLSPSFSPGTEQCQRRLVSGGWLEKA